MIAVQGHCPYGCGQTLFLGEGGFVTCSYLHCPEPDAVATLLDDRETDHIVTFGESGFTIRHPLRERLRDELETCDLHRWCADLPGPPVKPGRYRAVADSLAHGDDPPDWRFYETSQQPRSSSAALA